MKSLILICLFWVIPSFALPLGEMSYGEASRKLTSEKLRDVIQALSDVNESTSPQQAKTLRKTV